MGDMFKNSSFKNDSFKNNVLGKKKLYRVPEEGMLKGVCAGLAHYFDIPVRLIRVMVVLSLFLVCLFSLLRLISC